MGGRLVEDDNVDASWPTGRPFDGDPGTAQPDTADEASVFSQPPSTHIAVQFQNKKKPTHMRKRINNHD